MGGVSVVVCAQRCGWAAASASLQRSPRSGDSPALLDPRSHRGTRCVRCAHCAQTAAMSQMTKRVLRTRRPRVCAARRRRGAKPAARPHLCVNRSGLSFGRTAGSSKSRGRVAGRAPLRRRGAQGLGGCASPQGEASSAACLSTEHRQPAQQDAARARASSALAPGHRAPQDSRPAGTTAAVKHGRPPAHGFARARQQVRPLTHSLAATTSGSTSGQNESAERALTTSAQNELAAKPRRTLSARFPPPSPSSAAFRQPLRAAGTSCRSQAPGSRVRAR